MADELLTVYEAAERMRVHHTTIRRAIKAGELEYEQHVPYAPIKISNSALLAWRSRHRKPARAGRAKYGSRALNREQSAPAA